MASHEHEAYDTPVCLSLAGNVYLLGLVVIATKNAQTYGVVYVLNALAIVASRE
jgi:hypothetical protein